MPNRFSVLADDNSTKSNNTFKSKRNSFKSQTQRDSRISNRTKDSSSKYVPPSQRRNATNKRSDGNRFYRRNRDSTRVKKKTFSHDITNNKHFPALGEKKTDSKDVENKKLDLTNKEDRASFVQAVNQKIKKKKKEKTNVPEGWVSMKLTKNGIVRHYNPSKKKKVDKEFVITYALLKFFEDEKEIRLRQWMEAGYWDNRAHELEELYVSSEDEEDDYDNEYEYDSN